MPLTPTVPVRLRGLTLALLILSVPMNSCSLSNGSNGSNIPAQHTANTLPATEEIAAVPQELVLRLANDFAPILFYDKDEPNLPAPVEHLLANTELRFYDRNCRPVDIPAAKLNGSQIPKMALPGCSHPPAAIGSFGTRSTGKNATFYLRNVPEAEQRGSLDSQAWTTYVHAYYNDAGGITLQFWRFYAYNTAYFLGFRSSTASHAGDWEAIHIVFQAANRNQGPAIYEPGQIVLLGHTQLASYPWKDVIREANHPLIRCEKGSHTSLLMTRRDLVSRDKLIEQQSWTGGIVRWPDGRTTRSGPLVDLGSKTHPAAGLEWLQYSGLWGTRESGMLGYYRSGYWGPAFNETGMRTDGFVTAWCDGIARARGDREAAALHSECYPSTSIP